MLRPPMLVAMLILAGSCSTSEPGATDTQPSTSVAAPQDAVDVVVLSDSLAQGGWPETWTELIQVDLDVDVDLHDLSVSGKADYEAMLGRSDVRQVLREAEVVFISPDPDYLRDACPPGTSDQDCVTEFTTQYRDQWAGWLDDIDGLTDGAVVRSAEAWAWLAPSGARSGLSEFMGRIATETLAHGGLVADLNRALTGDDLREDPPPDAIDPTGHLTGPGADTMAELLHELGYDALT